MIWNRLKTVVFLALLSGILLFVGSLVGGSTGIAFALILAIVMNFIAYFFSDKIILSIYRAKKLDPEEHPEIYSMVSELCDRMKIPMPKLCLMKNDAANAFATGRNPKNASVALTSGIIDVLEPYEIRAVISHELAHVKNRDILIMTIAATIATAISYLSHIARYAFIWQGSAGGRKKSGNFILLLLTAIFTPIAALLIQLAISRSREYLADETGAEFCEDPLALASALRKLHNQSRVSSAESSQVATYKRATASLFIVNPFSGGGFIRLFSTHPSMDSRIEKLERIYEKKFLRPRF